MTTKDGIRSQTMIRPSIAAIAVVAAMATTMAAQVGNGCAIATIHREMAPPIPALKPSDRSISPSSSGNVCAMQNVMMKPACVIRFAMLPADRKAGSRIWK